MNEVRPLKPGSGQLSVPSSLIAQAKALGVDAEQAAADGIRRAVLRAQATERTEQNRAAAEAWNAYIAENGSPFADIMEQPV